MTDPPDLLIIRPNRPGQAEMADPLSDVLRSVRLTGGIFLDAQFTAPWCVRSKITPNDCAPFLASPTQIIAYHYVIEGRLVLALEEGRSRSRFGRARSSSCRATTGIRWRASPAFPP